MSMDSGRSSMSAMVTAGPTQPRREPVTITRAGQPVAELRPVPRPPLMAETLLARWRRLPYVDYQTMREEIDEILDPSL
jgi:antitoxin (DNA-binding transcriptional repressor) of toxin-antitoxin stability system